MSHKEFSIEERTFHSRIFNIRSPSGVLGGGDG